MYFSPLPVWWAEGPQRDPRSDPHNVWCVARQWGFAGVVNATDVDIGRRTSLSQMGPI